MAKMGWDPAEASNIIHTFKGLNVGPLKLCNNGYVGLVAGC